MIKARASGSNVYLNFMKKGRQARHRIPQNSCICISDCIFQTSLHYMDVAVDQRLVGWLFSA